ncbi:MAG: isochorismatase family protein [Alphaproteobacteria bacterium]|nr:isochorismatase family protein [Alphaproteobacteria bacterium]
MKALFANNTNDTNNEKDWLFTHIEGQNDFMKAKGVLGSQGAEDLIEPTNRFVREGVRRKAFGHILTTGDYHVEEEYLACTYSPEGATYPHHCGPGTWGFEYAIDFPAKGPMRTQLWKKDTSMWHNSATINGKPANVEARFPKQKWKIVMGGVCTDICVELAFEQFLVRGYEVVILTDLVKGYQKEIAQVVAEGGVIPGGYQKYIATGQLRLMTSEQFIAENAKVAEAGNAKVGAIRDARAGR